MDVEIDTFYADFSNINLQRYFTPLFIDSYQVIFFIYELIIEILFMEIFIHIDNSLINKILILDYTLGN